MKELCFDVETTTYNKGNPFDQRNQLVCIAYADKVVRPTPYELGVFQEAVNKAETLIGFNLKFDLHWIRKLGITLPEGIRVYDVQATEFVLSGQTHKFPSLNEVSAKYGGKQKLDEVAELWDAGVQTTDIPWDILATYAAMDIQVTMETRAAQLKATPAGLARLISLVNQDLLVLAEMEWNGIKFDRELSLKKADLLVDKIEELQAKHNMRHNIPNFNWASNDHVSALLFGGTISEPIKVPVGHYKTGEKAGQIKYKNELREHKLPRIYKPVKGSNLKKEGFYSVDEDSLMQLDGSDLIMDLLAIKKMQKEISTYLKGLPDKQDEGGYEGYIYGQFNQCVAATGRLSSSKPNLQNLSEEAGRCLVSRYE